VLVGARGVVKIQIIRLSYYR